MEAPRDFLADDPIRDNIIPDGRRPGLPLLGVRLGHPETQEWRFAIYFIITASCRLHLQIEIDRLIGAVQKSKALIQGRRGKSEKQAAFIKEQTAIIIAAGRN